MAFYIVPPVLLAAVFAFCALVPREITAGATTAAPAAVAAASSPGAAVSPAPAPDAAVAGGNNATAPTPVAATAVADLNDGLPEFEIPHGRANLLEGLESVSASTTQEDMEPINAVDGTCDNDRHVATAMPDAQGSAWWQIDAPKGAPLVGDCVVVYGGGSASPAGKMLGGFRVDVTLADGSVLSRNFCEPGFALEGYEAWKLGGDKSARSLRVTALQSGKPVVLREVLFIGASTEDDEEEDEDDDFDDASDEEDEE